MARAKANSVNFSVIFLYFLLSLCIHLMQEICKILGLRRRFCLFHSHSFFDISLETISLVGKKRPRWSKEGSSSESSESSTKTVTFWLLLQSENVWKCPRMKKNKVLATFGYFWPLLAISKVQKRCRMSLDFKGNDCFTSNVGWKLMKDIQLFFQLRIEASSVTLVDTFMNRSDSQMDFKGPVSLFNCSFLNCARPKNWKIL